MDFGCEASLCRGEQIDKLSRTYNNINRFSLVNNVYEFEDGRNILTLFKIKVIYIFNSNKNCILITSFAVLGYLSNVIKMCI